jgi:hypothetical protein
VRKRLDTICQGIHNGVGLKKVCIMVCIMLDQPSGRDFHAAEPIKYRARVHSLGNIESETGSSHLLD